MKYLKLFNESLQNDLLMDIRDILIDFSDSGNEVQVDWIDSRYKDEIAIVIKNNSGDLGVDNFIRLFTYMKDWGFQCNHILCQDESASDKIYIMQSAKYFGLDWDIQTINSWKALELVFRKVK